MNWLHWIHRFLKVLIITVGVYFILIYCFVSVTHIRFPFALEWMEGGILDHVQRILMGQRVYGAPALDFSPFIYSPLYFYICAGMSFITGFGFETLRFISFLASVGSLCMIYLLVRRETSNTFAGATAAFFFAATYRISGPYFDMGRVDSLFLFFFLAALYLVKICKTKPLMVLAAFLACASCLTKQSALVLTPVLLLSCLLFQSRSNTALFVLTYLFSYAASTVCIDIANGGWYWFYVFQLPGQHPLAIERFAYFWTHDILLALPLGVLCALIGLCSGQAMKPTKNRFFYMMLAFCMLAFSCMSRLKVGGFTNVLFPAYAVISILFGFSTGSLLQDAHDNQNVKRNLLKAGIYLLCLVQLGMLLYDPRPLIPREKYRTMCERLVVSVSRIKGEVFMPAYGYLGKMAKKNGSIHIAAVDDILLGQTGLVQQKLIYDIRKALSEQKYSAIILDRKFTAFNRDIQENYLLLKDFDPDRNFWPLVKYVYVPRLNPFSLSKHEAVPEE